MKGKIFKKNNKFIIPILCIAIIAVLLIPMLYSSIYLGSVWNVYGKLDSVPVAFVNSDKSVIMDGKEYAIGDEVKNNLKNNKQVSWNFVSHEKALKGVKGSKYYAMIEIPENFSGDIADVQKGDIKEPQIIYMGNKGKNFVFSQISARVADGIKTEVSSSIQKEISKALVDNLYDVKSSINTAGDGAKEIQSGTQKLFDGSVNLANGLNSASNGSKQLLSGLGTITSGQTQILNGSSSLVDGLKSLKSSLTQSNDKIPSLVQRASSLDSNTGILTQKTNDLYSYVAGVASEVRKADSTLHDKIDAINNSNLNDEDKQKIVEAIESLDNVSTTDTNDQSKLANNINIASYSVHELASKVQDLKAGTQQVSSDISGVVTGLADNQKKASAGVDQLISGAISIQNGSSSILNGLNTAKNKTGDLVSGLEKLNGGSESLETGLQSANQGVTKLADGLTEGYDKMNSKLKFNSDNMSKFVSKPVTVKDESINNVKYYGQGLAPYFISLSLWIGAMFISMVFSIAKAKKVFKSKFMNSFIGKYIVGCVLVSVQACILSFTLLKMVGIIPTSPSMFYVTNIFISIVFFSIMYGVSHAIGIFGSPIMFILLLLQLASSGGTFPIETAPIFYRVINKVVPMTYSISTLRMTLSSINTSVLHHNVSIMLRFVVVFTCGGYVVRFLIDLINNKKQEIECSEVGSEIYD